MSDVPEGYKMSEVGVIPEEWEVKTLGEIANFYSGGTPSTSNSAYYGGEIAWITSSDLNKKNIFAVEGRITQQGLENSSAKMVEENTLLIALYGATAAVTAITKIKAAINQAVLAIIPQEHDTQYLYYKISSLKTWIINTYTQGGQPNLSGNIVKSIALSTPPHPEQQAIVSALSDVDALITALEQLITKKRNIKQGAMQQLLTGEKRLPGFSGEWEVKILKEVVDFLDEKRRPIKDSDRAQMRGHFPYYGASGIIDYVNDYIFDDNLILLGEDGENIISRNSRLVFQISGKVWVNNHAHVLKPKPDTDLVFLIEYLESLNYELYNTGTAQPKLNKKVCSSIPVILPPHPEQQAIAKILSDMDTEIESLKQKRNKYKAIKQGMMQELLTGKTRLL